MCLLVRKRGLAREAQGPVVWCCRDLPSGDVELEWLATRQRLAPQQLVIPPECRTGGVRIYSGHPISRRVRSEVEGDVDHVDERAGCCRPRRSWPAATSTCAGRPLSTSSHHHNCRARKDTSPGPPCKTCGACRHVRSPVLTRPRKTRRLAGGFDPCTAHFGDRRTIPYT